MSKRTPSGAAALQSLECSSKDKGLEAKAIDHNIAVYPEFKSSLVLPQTLKTFDINAGVPEDTRLTCFPLVKLAHTRDGETKLTQHMRETDLHSKHRVEHKRKQFVQLQKAV